MKNKIKTSKNIAEALRRAIKRNQIYQGLMANDLKMTSSNISNQETKKFDTPIDSAFKFSVLF
ncbi:hypothetical protein [Lentilactobacillus kosonis]|uniref:Uncharacterized protein n=1 Tax=Lentilactobacillus kosonis TaxID=2810561 RepID=A0A401FPF4_9LACO|nr:hypothetical protein [Lentilactobacillus kosonis]GAY74233.1 hypothetical protein NBRC111893_2379 [Lentilactobacillus kosonis]